MRTIAVLQPFYIPWAGVFNQIVKTDIFVVGDNFQYSKNSWINRNRIKNANGDFMWLTVPVKKSSLSSQIRDIEIDYNIDWIKKHLNSLRCTYSSSPFFDELFKPIEGILLKKHKFLIDLNLDLLHFVCKILDIKTKIKLRSSYDLTLDKNISLLEICISENANRYLTGPKAQDYLNEKIFENNGVEVIYQNFSYDPYKQIGLDYVDKLSILDMLFMIGKEATGIVIRKEA